MKNKTSLIPAFLLIFKDQYSNTRIIFGIQNDHKLNMNINIWRKIFEYSNVFEYSFKHCDLSTIKDSYVASNAIDKDNTTLAMSKALTNTLEY